MGVLCWFGGVWLCGSWGLAVFGGFVFVLFVLCFLGVVCVRFFCFVGLVPGLGWCVGLDLCPRFFFWVGGFVRCGEKLGRSTTAEKNLSFGFQTTIFLKYQEQGLGDKVMVSKSSGF